MRLAVQLPESLGRKFKAAVPNGSRSRMVAELLAERLAKLDAAFESAAKKANTFKQVNLDMKAWEALNEVAV